MKWFLDLSMRSKLFVCFGLIFALMAWVIATAYSGIAAIKESQDRLYQEEFANVRDLAVLGALQNLIRVEILEALLTRESSSEQGILLRDGAERTKQIDLIMAGLPARARNDPKRLSRIAELKSVQQAFTRTKDGEIIPLIRAGKIAKAQQLAVGVQQPRSEKMRAIAVELSQDAEDSARQAEAQTDLQENRALRIFLFVAVATLVTGVLLALLLERVIAAPLRLLAAAADRIAGGDLAIELEQIDRSDEVGGLVLAFRAMVEGQRRTMREILEGVSVLKESERRITRLNRLYAVLSGINTAIVRARERQQLFEEACRIAVEHGQFRMAWIGLLDADGITVTPLAKAGIEEGYLESVLIRYTLSLAVLYCFPCQVAWWSGPVC